MAISGVSGVHVILTLFTIFFISFIDGLTVSSVSVSIKKKESALSKSLSKISRPQVPVPEFHKFVTRPSKNPSSQSSTSPSGSRNHHHGQQYRPSQSQFQQQQPIGHHSFSQKQQVHNIGPSIQIPSPTAFFQVQDDDDDEMSDDPSKEIIVAEADYEFHDGFSPFANFTVSSAPLHIANSQEKVLPSIPQTVMNLPALLNPGLMDSSSNPMSPMISFTGGRAPTSSSTSTKNDTGKSGNQVSGEKFQDASVDFSMPPHVLTILNALGGGGSLAQASKPEKDSAGYTTANAIGYATGDNATVTALVSNKLEVSPLTVITTETATAHASTLSNGMAFSQAHLGSNGWSTQLGQGGHWPAGPGSGWTKASKSIKKGRWL